LISLAASSAKTYGFKLMNWLIRWFLSSISSFCVNIVNLGNFLNLPGIQHPLLIRCSLISWSYISFVSRLMSFCTPAFFLFSDCDLSLDSRSCSLGGSTTFLLFTMWMFDSCCNAFGTIPLLVWLDVLFSRTCFYSSCRELIYSRAFFYSSVSLFNSCPLSSTTSRSGDLLIFTKFIWVDCSVAFVWAFWSKVCSVFSFA